MAFGEIVGYPPGSTFADRRALAASGVHRSTRAGIVGRAAEGAESVIVAGQYEDDEDLGDSVVYTGMGGRDPRTGRQVARQQLARQNLALAHNLRFGLPVRVVRGAGGGVFAAPLEGYRYDGLYRVEDYWEEAGASGFRVWRFRLVR